MGRPCSTQFVRKVASPGFPPELLAKKEMLQIRSLQIRSLRLLAPATFSIPLTGDYMSDTAIHIFLRLL